MIPRTAYPPGTPAEIVIEVTSSATGIAAIPPGATVRIFDPTGIEAEELVYPTNADSFVADADNGTLTVIIPTVDKAPGHWRAMITGSPEQPFRFWHRFEILREPLATE